MKKVRTSIKYVKAKDPSVFTYFTPESIKLRAPEKDGWIRDEKADHPAPADVLNFMKPKPIEVKAENIQNQNPTHPGLTDYSTVPTSKLTDLMKTMSEDNLLNIIKTDERVTAKRYAEKELKSRET